MPEVRANRRPDPRTPVSAAEGEGRCRVPCRSTSLPGNSVGSSQRVIAELNNFMNSARIEKYQFPFFLMHSWNEPSSCRLTRQQRANADGRRPIGPGGGAMAQTAGDVLVETLIDWGVDRVFGIPGDGINGVIESLRTRQDRIRFI